MLSHLSEWINTPLIVIAVLAVLGVLYKFARWQGTVDTDLTTIKGFMAEIREDIKKIFHRLPPSPVASGSPMRLTDFGENIARKFGAFEWAGKLAPRLVDKARGKEPFEVYDFSKEYVSSHWKEKWWRKVMECAYEEGTESGNVLAVMSVVLRDELLKLLKEEPPAP